MPRFVYEARSPTGQGVQGEIDAESATEARVLLRAQKLTPVWVSLQSANPWGFQFPSVLGEVRPLDVMVMTRQLAALHAAGVSLQMAVELLASGTPNGKLRQTLEAAQENLKKGSRFSDTLAAQPAAFDATYVRLLQLAEDSAAGALGFSLLGDYLEKTVQLQKDIRGIVRGLGGIAFIAALMGIAACVIVSVGSGSTAEMAFQVIRWICFTGLAMGLVGFVSSTLTTAEFRHKILVRIPILGRVFHAMSLSQISYSIYAMLKAGVALPEALEVSSQTAKHPVVAAALHAARIDAKALRSIVPALSREGRMSPALVQVIGVGEQKGDLADVFLKLAEFYSNEAYWIMRSWERRLEPLLVMLMGASLAGIFVALERTGYLLLRFNF
jgi:type IV pilus assembly protein PilC